MFEELEINSSRSCQSSSQSQDFFFEAVDGIPIFLSHIVFDNLSQFYILVYSLVFSAHGTLT